MRATTLLTGVCGRGARVALWSAMISLSVTGSALAQAAASGPNLGALTFTGGLDGPTLYVLAGDKGLLQVDLQSHQVAAVVRFANSAIPH